MGAVWTRPPDRTAPHVGLHASPAHQDMYFNTDVVVQNPGIMRRVAKEWADVIQAEGLRPDRIMTHAPDGIAPATILADVFRARGTRTRLAYAVRDEGGYRTAFPIDPGEKVLVLADDVLSGNPTRQTIAEAERHGAVVLPLVPCLGNLSLRPDLDGRPLLAAATFEPTKYNVDGSGQCELCSLGSVALPPRPYWPDLMTWRPTPPAS